MELRLLLSLGALLSESLSTRRDSVRAPDRLCVDEDRVEPEDRLREEDWLRELERERDERLFDFFEELPPERLLLFDRDFCWGILPALLLVTLGEASTRALGLPALCRSNPHPSG